MKKDDLIKEIYSLMLKQANNCDDMIAHNALEQRKLYVYDQLQSLTGLPQEELESRIEKGYEAWILSRLPKKE